jgi:hypothetical protein
MMSMTPPQAARLVENYTKKAAFSNDRIRRSPLPGASALEERRAVKIPISRRSNGRVTSFVGVLLLAGFFLLLSAHEASCRAAPDAWATATKLAQTIQTHSAAISDRDRRRFLAVFAELHTQHEKLQANERSLAMRLDAEKRDLLQYREASATYENHRAAWQEKLAAHNARCNRTFTDPAAVAQCDRSGDELGAEQKVLDAVQAELAARLSRLQQTHAKLLDLSKSQDADDATWATRVERDFNTPVRMLLARQTRKTLVRVTVKSFIRTIDLSSMSAESRPAAERLFAWFTNRNFSENPATPMPDIMDYRLWSQINIAVSCRGNAIAAWKVSNVAHRGGKELGILDAETSILDPLKTSETSAADGDLRSLTVSYAIKGSPNDATIPSFHAVHPRLCKSIWHRVRVTATCRQGDAHFDASLAGSRFPSHRIWLDDRLAATRDQGPFSNLWDCDPAYPDLVR